MRSQKRSIVLVLFIFMTWVMASQNNMHYTQYMFNGLLFNPAYAGSHDALNLTALYRNQWTGVAGAPRGISVTGHTPLKNKKINLGVSIEKEQVGLFDHTQLSLVYAYRLTLGKGKLSFGIKAGLDNRTLNRDGLLVTDTDDPTLYYGSNVTNAFVCGAGAYYFTPAFYAGFAAPSLVGAIPGQAGLMQLHTGALLRLSDNSRLKPSVLVRRQKGEPLYANLTTIFYYRELIGLGAGYSYMDTWLALLDLRLNEQLNFGYAYERQTGKHATFRAGSHEVMLRYIFRYRISAVNPRFF